MKVLLLGEFSGLHKNLQVGLRALGCQVDLMSSGDGFKGIFGDKEIPLLTRPTPYHKTIFRARYYKFLKSLADYDVVQLINYNVILSRFFPYRRALAHLKENNGKMFLLAAGSDAFYWQRARQQLAYGPFDDVERYDSRGKTVGHSHKRSLEFNQWLADSVDGIIPIAYEYWLGYKDQVNLRQTIPLPIDVSSIKVSENRIEGRLSVFHGLNRYGFKGTRHIEQAFAMLSKESGSKVQCRIEGGMPLSEYLDVLSNSNIVVDQANSYSYGMNALYAAALGKVVMSGCEPECLRALNIEESPIINIRPDPIQIKTSIKRFIEHPAQLDAVSHSSRSYVEQHHCCYKVAKAYLHEWRL